MFPKGKFIGGIMGSDISSSASGKYVTAESSRIPGCMNWWVIALGSEATDDGGNLSIFVVMS